MSKLKWKFYFEGQRTITKRFYKIHYDAGHTTIRRYVTTDANVPKQTERPPLGPKHAKSNERKS